MEISNFEADVLETQAELGKMLMIFVISISKLTKTARSDEEVREAYSDSLLVRQTSEAFSAYLYRFYLARILVLKFLVLYCSISYKYKYNLQVRKNRPLIVKIMRI